MPKIIENLREKLTAEAKRQILESGYAAVTIRSVASACQVGVGTVYNYFPSKDDLVASAMLEDWILCLGHIREVSERASEPKEVLEQIYHQFHLYAACYREVFQDPAAATAFSGSFSQRHSLLRKQLAEPLEKFCDSTFASEFISEAMLTWTAAGRSFQEIYDQVNKLF